MGRQNPEKVMEILGQMIVERQVNANRTAYHWNLIEMIERLSS